MRRKSYLLLEVLVAFAITSPLLAIVTTRQTIWQKNRIDAVRKLEETCNAKEAWTEAIAQLGRGKKDGSIEIGEKIYSWHLVEEKAGKKGDTLCTLICIELSTEGHTWQEWSIKSVS